MKNSEQPAMPVKEVWVKSDAVKSGGIYEDFSGLSKIEYFAGLAMQGLLASDTDPNSDYWEPARLATKSVTYAKALLAEIEKEKETANQ